MFILQVGQVNPNSARGMDPRMAGAPGAAEEAAPPDVLGLNEQQNNQLAFKNGEYEPKVVQTLLEDTVKSLEWSAKKLGGYSTTPNKQKNTDVPKGMTKLSTKLKETITKLEGILNETGKIKGTDVSVDKTVVGEQIKMFKAFERTVTLMTSGKSTLENALSKGKVAGVTDNALKIIQSKTSGDAKSYALGVIEMLKKLETSTVIHLKLEKLKPSLAKHDAYFNSPAAQALTSAALTRINMNQAANQNALAA